MCDTPIENIFVLLDEEYVQNEADHLLKRKLTSDELEDLREDIWDAIIPAVQDAIHYLTRQPTKAAQPLLKS